MKRGALIVFEGCDRAGKTTQCRKLVEKLQELGVRAQFMQFPDRSTATGKIIDGYLRKKEDLPDRAVHLLFSANRWENQPKMKKLLQEGTTLIVDRYSYSGVAYSAAKPGMDLDWCYKPEIGLPKPDLVFLLHIPVSVSNSRGGFGEERYESSDFQKAVFENYMKMKDDTWEMVDARQSIDEIHGTLVERTRQLLNRAGDADLQEFT